jgi:hypothetical protein
LGSWLRGFKRDDIPADSFELKHARSSGAGGQNVNKGPLTAAWRCTSKRQQQFSQLPLFLSECVRLLTRCPRGLACVAPPSFIISFSSLLSEHEGGPSFQAGSSVLASSPRTSLLARVGAGTHQQCGRIRHHQRTNAHAER